MTVKSDTTFVKKRAPTLYAIIAFKLIKGLLLVGAAITAYTLSDNILPDEFRKVLSFLHLDPGTRFFRHVATSLATITEREALVFAGVTLFYSLFSLVEGMGMIFRIGWAGWLAIGESAFFVPIEINSLVKDFRPGMFLILLLNMAICWYLFCNRNRLFRHHHHHDEQPDPEVTSDPEL